MVGHVQPHTAPAPVNALPTEILSQIFQHLAWMEYGSFRGRGWKRTKWIPAMLCCRRWRSIALATAGLWSTIVLDGKEPVDVFLERSGKRPLEIIGAISFQNDRHNQRICQLLKPAHIARLKTLKVVDQLGIAPTLSRPESLIARLLAENAYAPELENLCLEDSSLKYGLLHTFLSFQCPRLGKLALTNAFFPCGTHLSGLRSLRLNNAPDYVRVPCPYTFDEILESLAAMPSLESLCMAHALTRTVADQHGFIQNRNPITMPHLRSLVLASDSNECWVLWALLVCNSSVTVQVFVHGPSPVGVLSMALSRHTHRSDCPQYDSLEVDLDLGDLGERMLNVCLTTAERNWGPKLNLTFRVHNDEPAANTNIHVEVFDHAITHVLDSIPLKNLTKLTLWANYSPSDNFASLFAAATCISHITLRGTCIASAFCSLLVPWDVLYDGRAFGTNLPLPNLAEVDICLANLTRHVNADGYLSQPIGGHLSLALAVRKAAGHGMRRLNVEDYCTLDSSWVRLWKQTVEEVQWDGDTSEEDYEGTSEEDYEGWSGEDQ